MHILILPSWYVSSYNDILGIFFKEQAEALSQRGHNVGVVSVQAVGIRQVFSQKKLDFSFSQEEKNGVNIFQKQYLDLKLRGTLKKKLQFRYFRILFEQYIAKYGTPDIVHVHSFFVGEWAIYIKNKYDIPFVVTEHSSGFEKSIFTKSKLEYAKNVYRQSSYNIAVSQALKKKLYSLFNVLFFYIPNMVNMDFFIPTVKKNTKKFSFINIAMLDENKNHCMLVESFAKAFKHNTHIQLTIVGEGKTYTKIKSYIQACKMEEQIFLYGRAKRESIRELLQKSDAFVLSSKVETFGVVVIEAMSCGLPVVSTRCGGPESIVTANKLGLLSEISVKDLSKKMLNLYEQKETYDGAYIRNHVKKYFSKESVCIALEQIYHKVLK